MGKKRKRHKRADVQPFPGMQTRFLASGAEVVIAGSRAGPGKTYSGLLHVLHWLRKGEPGVCIVFRRRYMDLAGLFRTAKEIFEPLGFRCIKSPYTCTYTYEDGSELEVRLACLPEAGDERRHKGFEYVLILFEEATDFLWSQITYMLTRKRRTKKSKIVPMVRLTCNPDFTHPLRKLIDWYIGIDGKIIEDRDGVIMYFQAGGTAMKPTFDVADNPSEIIERALAKGEKADPMSFTVLQGKPEDNPALRWEEYHRGIRQSETYIVEQLIGANWDAAPRRPGQIYDFPQDVWVSDDEVCEMIARNGPLAAYGGLDYGRAEKAMAESWGVIEPLPEPVLWILVAFVWTNVEADVVAADRLGIFGPERLAPQIGRIWTAQRATGDQHAGLVGGVLPFELEIDPERSCDFGDPSGKTGDSGAGWFESLAAYGVPMSGKMHMDRVGAGEGAVYWNTPEGFFTRTRLLNRWAREGRLKIRACLGPMVECAAHWRYKLRDGVDPQDADVERLKKGAGIHSHIGDAASYKAAGIADLMQVELTETEASGALAAQQHALRSPVAQYAEPDRLQL